MATSQTPSDSSEPLLRNDPLFDLYNNDGKLFDKFLEKNMEALRPILVQNIKNTKPLVGKECLESAPRPSRIKIISTFCASYAGMRGVNDVLRQKFRVFAQEVDRELMKEYLHSEFTEHWKNVAYYSFVILYLKHVKNTKASDPKKC